VTWNYFIKTTRTLAMASTNERLSRFLGVEIKKLAAVAKVTFADLRPKNKQTNKETNKEIV
jgi:hypothetical protein